MKILSFESSCDETSASVTLHEKGKNTILSNIVASQIDIHAAYGGVVPEIASRAHTEAISGVAREALSASGCQLEGIDAIAVTAGPGLVGALLVGVSFAKGLAASCGRPLIPVNHIRGHVAANYYLPDPPEPPFLALVVSGGHTSLIRVRSYTDFETVGRTRDDAAGECFDKTARVMGMPYPGGAMLDRAASLGDPKAFDFPSAAIPGDNLDFSFSGIKTNVINLIHKYGQSGAPVPVNDIAASLTRAVVSSFVKKLALAYEKGLVGNGIVLAGGVSANSHLRSGVGDFAEKKRLRVYMPEKSLCGDNAAMIGAQGYYEFLAGNTASPSLNADPRMGDR
ncbi:MAG: tRNA (adenosine(37)-N6)-threonylcarbamoyltransferase complex transferase subunit TsaD [Clostridia bacterium]|nr:tRNA (adenosine(37)-N6)-threonylcarbamoyltransferase complex transferase subunit TsaD [Clostridia bacterium]